MSQINFSDLKRLNFTILNNYLLHTSKFMHYWKTTCFKMLNPGLLCGLSGTESIC